jgi:hypothetical protein
MRYRLRTLLIVVTLISIPLGWIAWLKRIAAFHRREADRFSTIIQAAERQDSDNAGSRVEALAANGSLTKWVVVKQDGGDIVTYLRNGNSMTYSYSTAVNNWGKAVYHSVMAHRCEQALYRPWILCSTCDASDKTVRVPLADDTWTGLARSVMREIDP